MSIEIEIHAIGGFCNNNNNKSFAIQYSDKVGQYEYIHAHVKPPGTPPHRVQSLQCPHPSTTITAHQPIHMPPFTESHFTLTFRNTNIPIDRSPNSRSQGL